MPLAFAPGTAFDFNHVNSQALHAILTGETGMRYADFVREYLWQPLGCGFAQVRLDHEGGTALLIPARGWSANRVTAVPLSLRHFSPMM